MPDDQRVQDPDNALVERASDTNGYETATPDHGGNGDELAQDRPSGRMPLFKNGDDYRRQWEAVQTGFVDEPRRAVERADALVAEVVQALVSSFAEERDRLEGQWSGGSEVSTEALRIALQRYRSFFDRLLTA